MKTRNVNVTLEKAKEWYKKGGDLKEVALQAFTEEELKGVDFKSITTMINVIKVLGIDYDEYSRIVTHLYKYSKASAASFKLNLVRKALNLSKEMTFMEGTVWYPYVPAILPSSRYHDEEFEVARVKIGSDIFTLLGGDTDDGCNYGLGTFSPSYSVAHAASDTAFLGCATKEIAQHMGKYFAKLIFEAKYGDTVDYKWV